MVSSTFGISHSLDVHCRFASNFFGISLAGNESPIFGITFNSVCGTSGFRRYLEYNFYRRTEIRCGCSCGDFRTLVIGYSRNSNLLANCSFSRNDFIFFCKDSGGGIDKSDNGGGISQVWKKTCPQNQTEKP